MTGAELIWPNGEHGGELDISLSWQDLELERLSALLLPGCGGEEALGFLSPLLTRDPDTIRLRQQTVTELLGKPELTETLKKLAGLLTGLEQAVKGVQDNMGGLRVSRMDAAMDGVKKAILKLEKNLSKQGADILEETAADNRYAQLLRLTMFRKRQARFTAEALCLLRDSMKDLQLQSPLLKELQGWAEESCRREKAEHTLEVLDGLDREWKGLAAFAIDVCMDGHMGIVGLEVAETREEVYPRLGMIGGAGTEEERSGITNGFAFPQNGSATLFQEYLLSEVGYELRTTLTKQREIAWKLPVNTADTLLGLRESLRFYTAAADFAARLRMKGAPLCCPQPGTGQVLEAIGAFLPEQTCTGELPVPNDIMLQPGGSVLVTGPNSSGKTCWLILCGQLLFLSQLGLPIPAEEAVFAPRDALLTLFAAGESETGADSRMGLEVQRLGVLQQRMTPDSLMLLNEPMTSTSAAEGGEICADLLASLSEKQITNVLVTHFNHIWPRLQTLFAEKQIPERLKSMVMTAETTGEGIRYLYRLKEAPPPPDSHARAVAAKAGVSLPDMLQRLRDKGLDVRMEDEVWSRIGRQIMA